MIILAAVVIAAPAIAQTGQGNAVAGGIRAQLVPREFTTLSSEISARVDRIAARSGEHFNKGDVLAVFDCVMPRAQLKEMRAIELVLEKKAALNEPLAALKPSAALEASKLEIALEAARKSAAAAEARVAKCAIAAPFSGVTVEERAHAYQYLTPGTPILDILDDHRLEVEFLAPESDVRWLVKGYPFEIHVDELDKSFPARVTRLGARIDPASRSIKVTGEIAGAADGLIAGMSGRVELMPERRAEPGAE